MLYVWLGAWRLTCKNKDMKFIASKKGLDGLYARYNRRSFVHPDPLEFLYRYGDFYDREVAGLAASSLAYGRVSQILKSVSIVLDKMGPRPRLFLMESPETRIKTLFAGFKHRFTTGGEFSRLMIGAKRAIERHDSLKNCFLRRFDGKSDSILPSISNFVDELCADIGPLKGLLPSPSMGSACKRLNLFLRWMIRKDAVDPGGWGTALKSRLIVPLDTHMHKIGLAFGFTRRKNAGIETAIEITRGFAKFSPDDPVKYDFALTRLGIRGDANFDFLQTACQERMDWLVKHPLLGH